MTDKNKIEMNNYLTLDKTGPDLNTRVPSMSVQLVPETFNVGYNSVTHNSNETSNNYLGYQCAYFVKEVPKSGYKFHQRSCDGFVRKN